jgi:hypothetical protein
VPVEPPEGRRPEEAGSVLQLDGLGLRQEVVQGRRKNASIFGIEALPERRSALYRRSSSNPAQERAGTDSIETNKLVNVSGLTVKKYNILSNDLKSLICISVDFF